MIHNCFVWSNCFIAFLLCLREASVLARPSFMHAALNSLKVNKAPENRPRMRPEKGGYLELMKLTSGRWSTDNEPCGVVNGGEDIVLLPGEWIDRDPKWTWEKLQAAVQAVMPEYVKTDCHEQAELEKENQYRQGEISPEEHTFSKLPQAMLVEQVERFPELQSFFQITVLAPGTRGRLSIMEDIKKASKKLLAMRKITLTEGKLWIQCFAHLSAVDKRQFEDIELEALIQYTLLDLKTRFRPISREKHLARQKLYAFTARLLEALQKRATRGMNQRNFALFFVEAGHIPWARELLYPEAGIMTYLNDDLPKFQRWFEEEKALRPHLKTLQKLSVDSLSKEKGHGEISEGGDANEVDELIKNLGKMCRKDNLQTSARTKTATISLLLCIESIARVYKTDFQSIHKRVLKELMELISENENYEINVWWHDFKLICFSIFFKAERLPLRNAEEGKLMKVTRESIANLVGAHASGSHS